jgi:hypothetical protein
MLRPRTIRLTCRERRNDSVPFISEQLRGPSQIVIVVVSYGNSLSGTLWNTFTLRKFTPV